MTRNEIKGALGGVIEDLAHIEHERWSDWQKHVHAKAQRQPDGSLLIPAGLVAAWGRQIATPYAELSEGEKESDREQVRRYLPTIIEAFFLATRSAQEKEMQIYADPPENSSPIIRT